ncbi:uncharacterized protein TNCV_3494171 [Trichonephila clavipes]|nr:uncharacterized protein TNCV_3494171 [Trichonephila clavipes]
MLHVSRSVGLARKTEPEKCVEQAVVGFRRRKRLQNDNYREEISDFAQSILGFQECDEDVETWMAYDAEDCGFQMLHDDEIVMWFFPKSVARVAAIVGDPANTRLGINSETLDVFLRYSRPSSFHTLPKLIWCGSWGSNLGQ